MTATHFSTPGGGSTRTTLDAQLKKPEARVASIEVRKRAMEQVRGLAKGPLA